MGLSIRIKCRYGFAFSAHCGTTLSSIDGGACGRSDIAGLTSSEVKPGGGVGGCESDELSRMDAANGRAEKARVGRRGILERTEHLRALLPIVGSMVLG